MCVHHYYRPQMKFAKVMFSQVSVCPQWGGSTWAGIPPGRYTHTPPTPPPRAGIPQQVHPPGQVHTPQAGTPPSGRYLPGHVPPRTGTPPGRHPRAGTHPQAGTPSQAGTPPRQVHPSGQVPPGRYTPQAGTPPGRYTPPATVHAGIRSTSGRYAFHWNAFLFGNVFVENCFKMKEIEPGVPIGSANALQLHSKSYLDILSI